VAAIESDSYCAATDVAAITQFGTLGVGTVPTAQQGLEFQKQRAADLYTILRDVMGTAAPGPVSYDTVLDTTSDVGKALSAVLVQYNTIGAAFDVLQAAGATESPGRSERLAELYQMWQDRDGPVRQAALMYQGYASRTSTHISSGEITEKSVTSREEDGLAFNGATDW
jgi:hypothetical protein